MRKRAFIIELEVVMDSGKWRFSILNTCGTFGAAFMLVAAICLGGGAGFINIPSIMITFGVAFFMMLACFRGEYAGFLWASFKVLLFRPVEPNRRYAEMAVYAGRFMIGAGIAGTVIGLIQMLRNMCDPSSIGAGMAVALITFLYAIFGAEFWCAFVYKVFADGTESKSLRHGWFRSLALAFVAIAWLMLTFFVMLLSFAEPRRVVEEYEDWNMSSRTIVSGDNQTTYFAKVGSYLINIGSEEDASVLFMKLVLETKSSSRDLLQFGPLLHDRIQTFVKNSSLNTEPGADDGEGIVKAAVLQGVNKLMAEEAIDNSVTDVLFEEFVVVPADPAISLMLNKRL